MIMHLANGDFSSLESYDLIYVASPYTKYTWGIDEATKDIAKVSGRLIMAGLNVFSPIVHAHTISMNSSIEPLDHDLWLKVDAAFMRKCDALLICQMTGWDVSYGVDYEIKFFNAAHKPMYSFDPGLHR